MPKLCEFKNCRLRATYGVSSNPISCKKHKSDFMRLSSLICKFNNCQKISKFNYNNETKPLYCSEHKMCDMVDIRSKKCIIEGCNKNQPCFNYENEISPLYCFEHKMPNMVDIKSKKCKFDNCKKRPSFNYINDKSPIYCSDHKLINMIDVISKKCKFENCNKNPAFNYFGKAPLYCYEHKLNDMENVKNKRCVEPLCQKHPTYNYIDQNIPIYCFEHKLSDMIHLKKLCSEPNCYNYPSYNFEGNKTAAYCSLHKKHGMINNYYLKCQNELCKKIPNYNYKGEKNAIFCFEHKEENMVDVHHAMCKADNCQTRGNKNYKGYCVNCFQHLFPYDPLTFQIRSKTKEIAVRDFINSRFEGFQHDKPLWYNETACDCTTKRRVDHRKLINDTLLCIETDENQHKYYSKEDEIARYNDLFMAYGGKFIFIRFNPDKYVEDGKTKNPMLVNRLPVLESEINKQIKRIEMSENTELLEVIELYYDKK
jgi:hypothetical protein